jgi:hypothetical protein
MIIKSIPPLVTLWENDYISEIIQRLQVSENLKILIYSENYPNIANEILQICSSFKPDIIIHLSDEWGDWENKTDIYQCAAIVFRQYSHKHYPELKHVYQIPLGYMNHFGHKDQTIMKVQERNHVWGFCGDFCKKSHDGKSSEHILPRLIKFRHFLQKTKPEDMFKIYNNSVFMPNRRGNITLDCFRIYEAALAGCIPIIQGHIDELRNTFKFNLNSDIVPFIFTQNLEIELDNILHISEDTDKLQDLSNRCVIWFDNQITSIVKKIEEYDKQKYGM